MAGPAADYALHFARNNTVELPKGFSLDPASDFTLEGFVRLTGGYCKLIGDGRTNLQTSNQPWVFLVDGADPISSIIGKKAAFMNGDRSVHVAGVRAGADVRLYVDGLLVASKKMDGKILTRQGNWRIGDAEGLLREIRISKVARYTNDFTPAKRFEPDADTLALYHFDEGTGDVLTDSSGHGHHGKIVGAKWVKADGTPLAPGPAAPFVKGQPKLLHDIRAFVLDKNSLDKINAMGNHVSFSRDGSLLVASGRQTGERGSVRVYDPKAGEEVGQLLTKGNSSRSEWAPEGDLLAAFGHGKLHFWEWPSKKELETVSTYLLGPSALTFSPDGRWLVWGDVAADDKSDAVLHWRDRQKPKDMLAPTSVGKYYVNQAVFSPDSRYLAAMPHQGELKVFDASNRQLLFEKPTGGGYSVSFSRQGKMLAASGIPYTTFWVFSIPDGRELAKLTMPSVGHAGPFLDDDRLATWTGEDGNISFIDTATWKVTLTFKAHDGPIRGEAVSPDGTLLATLDKDGTLKIWDLRAAQIAPAPPAVKWVQLFNGKDLTGWKTHPSSPGQWKVEDGILIGSGPKQNFLFSERGDYENIHFRVEVMINAAGNSGQFFRSQFTPGNPKGYEAQISLSDKPQQTGSLFDIVKIAEPLHKPDEWFTQEVIADGDHIRILVNDKVVVDTHNKLYSKGHFALQLWSAATVVKFRKIEVKELPATKSASGGDDRKAAEWVLSIGGKISIDADGKKTEIAAVKDLPAGAWQLVYIDLTGNKQVTDAGLEHLKGLTNLTSLSLGNTKMTPAGVEALRKALPKCEIITVAAPK